MSVERTNKGGNAQQPNFNQNQNIPPHQPQPEAAPQPTQRPGMRRLNEVLKRGATSERSEARVAEALKQMNSAAEEGLKTQVMTFQPDLIRFDRQTNNVSMSAILATLKYQKGGTTYVAVRPLLLESHDSPLPKRQRTIGNTRVEIQMRPQDVYDQKYWDRIVSYVREQVKVPDAEVIDAGVLLVTEKSKLKDSGFDFDDHDAVKELVVQTANRLEDALAPIRHEPPLNLQDVMQGSDRLRVNVDTADDTVTYDGLGNPVRSDMRITMRIAERQEGVGQGSDDYMAETDLNYVTAYVDAEYTRQQQVQPNQFQPNMQPPKEITPVIVATMVRNASWIQANTMELYLLALSNMYRCLNNMAWAQTWNPKFTGPGDAKDVNTRDVAALGYLTAARQKPNLMTDSTGDDEFVKFLNAVVDHRPAFAIDVDPVGENIALEIHLLLAASDNAVRQQAKDYIIRAANNLTNNAFSRHFDSAKEILVPYGTEVHMGSYQTRHGETRDIRDLDTIAVLNRTQGNQEEFRSWYNTRLPQCGPGETFETKLQKREQLERLYLSQSMTINRRGVRLLWSQEFLDALDAATHEAGARVEMNSVSGLNTEQFMGNTTIGSFAAQGAPRMNTFGNTQPGAGFNYNHGGMGGYNQNRY